MDNIYVTRSSMPAMQEYIDEISELWGTHFLTNMGRKHEQFRHQLEEYLRVNYIELFVNGHMALEMSLQALGIKGEVITTPFTFASTTHAIVRNGFKPIFCDIDPDKFTIDSSKIESLITDRTVAILPVHVYGNICDVEGIAGIAEKYNLKVIYDAAHAFGEIYKGRGIGTFGDISCFSFHATKVFNTVEGGAACYKDPVMGSILYGLKNFGIRNQETVDLVGANAKMNEFCAAMGICNLRHIDEEISKRKTVYERYCERLEGIKGIRINEIQKDVKSNYAYFPVVFDEKVFGAGRDEVKQKLEKEGVFTRKYFFPLTSRFDCYKGVLDPGNTPEALEISRRVLTLPIYADMSVDVVDRICDLIIDCMV